MSQTPPLAEMFTELARTRRDHPALVGATRTVTYGELDRRGNRVAHALRDLGVGEGDRVAYLDLNNPEFFEVMLGAARIGAAIAPLNFRLTPAEMGRIVDDAEATVMVVGPAFEAAVAAIQAEAPRLSHVVRTGEDFESWIAGASEEDPGRASTSRRRGAAALHLRHHRTAQGRAAHQRQLLGADGRRRRVGRRRDLGVAGRDAAVPHRRVRVGQRGAGPRRHRRAGPDDRPRRPARHDRERPHHQRVPGPRRAADDVRGPGCRRPRLLQPALDRLRRLADHHGGVEAVARRVPGAAVPGLRPHRDDRRDHRAELDRPRPRRASPAPAALGRQALPVGGDAGRRPGHRQRRAAPARSARSGPGRGRTPPATGTSRPTPPPRSTRTGGCTPATPATSTTRASCSSPTGSRT